MIAALNFSPFPLYLAERAEPSRKRVPLVVVEEQRVVHANVPARRHGITAGMRLDGARMRVSHLEVVRYTEPDLEHAWGSLLRELNDYTPWVEANGRGRALARLDAQEGLELARHYDIPVGLADDCETAELASLSARPGCTREVSSLTTAAFIDRLPLRFLKGVGLSEANYTRLQWLGVATAGDLARWSAELGGWEKLVNRASMTWRNLPDERKTPGSDAQWQALIAEFPALVRRPLVVWPDGSVTVGFTEKKFLERTSA